MKKNAKNKNIIISIQGGGLSYNGEIDQDIAARIVSLCLSKEKHGGPDVNGDDSYGSIAEYFDQVNPRRNPDKILTIASYLSKKGQRLFVPQDIKPLFSKAGEPVPGNFGRDFRWVQSVKWIAEDDNEKGQFYITKKGFEVLKKGFPKELIKETRGKAHKGRSRRKKKIGT